MHSNKLDYPPSPSPQSTLPSSCPQHPSLPQHPSNYPSRPPPPETHVDVERGRVEDLDGVGGRGRVAVEFVGVLVPLDGVHLVALRLPPALEVALPAHEQHLRDLDADDADAVATCGREGAVRRTALLALSPGENKPTADETFRRRPGRAKEGGEGASGLAPRRRGGRARETASRKVTFGNASPSHLTPQKIKGEEAEEKEGGGKKKQRKKKEQGKKPQSSGRRNSIIIGYGKFAQ
nr:uncharacterized protein LOC113816560 [Penaeus vannamei]